VCVTFIKHSEIKRHENYINKAYAARPTSCKLTTKFIKAITYSNIIVEHFILGSAVV